MRFASDLETQNCQNNDYVITIIETSNSLEKHANWGETSLNENRMITEHHTSYSQNVPYNLVKYRI